MLDGRLNAWWWRRIDELLPLVEGKTPVLVIDEETINDTFFDLLCLEPVQKVLYTPSFSPHPLLTEKAIQMGMGIKCFRPQEINTIEGNHAQLKPCHFLLVAEDAASHERLVFRERNLKIALPPGRVSEALELGINPEDILLICHSPAQLPQMDWGHPLGGLYLCCQTGRFAHALSKAGAHGKAPLLVLSGSRSVCVDPETGTLDISSTHSSLEKTAQALPNHTLWLDPEGAVLTKAIALFVTAREIKHKGTNTYAMVDLDRPCVPYLTSPESLRLVFNLTRPQEAARITPQAAVSDSIPCPHETRPGDLLVITNTWEMALSNTPCKVRLHYLKARRICQVRL